MQTKNEKLFKTKHRDEKIKRESSTPAQKYETEIERLRGKYYKGIGDA